MCFPFDEPSPVVFLFLDMTSIPVRIGPPIRPASERKEECNFYHLLLAGQNAPH